jgi:hypothetical protein
MFTLLEGVDEELVKKCALKKMALAFSTFKKKETTSSMTRNRTGIAYHMSNLTRMSSRNTSCPSTLSSYLKRTRSIRMPRNTTTTSGRVDIRR